ncbi:Intracellular serine protease [Paramyrothecium foliicola]|nr:Intracellular serine protease [Paramyrothecium foliicola]
MEGAVTEYLEPPDESHELLELLHNVIRDLTDHYQQRFKNQADKNLVRMRLIAQLDELNLFLGEYIKQGIPVDKELYTAAYRVAESLKSTLHRSRIQEVLRSERLELKIAQQESCISGFPVLEDFRTLVYDVPKSRQTPFNRQLVKNMAEDVCTLLTARFSDLVSVLWRRNPNSEMTPQAAKISQPPKMRYSEKDFTTELSWFHCHEQLYVLLRQYWPCTCQGNHKDKLGDFDGVGFSLPFPDLPTEKRLRQPCQELLDAIRGWKLKIIAPNITASAAGDADFIPFEIDPPEPSSWITLQNVIDNQRFIFPLRERRFLAVILMYSFMQLLRGSWLVEQWGGADIWFNSEGPNIVDLRRPYFSACWMASQNKKPQQVKLHDDYHPMPDMVTLARYLLELELQDTPFSPSITEGLHSNLLKSSRLIRTIETLDKDCWSKALFIKSMAACLDPETYINHDDPNSRHLLWWNIYQKVVNPLEQNILSILGPQATSKDLTMELSGAATLIHAISELGAKSANTNQAAEQYEGHYFFPNGIADIFLGIIRLTESDKWFKRLNGETHAMLDSVKDRFQQRIHVAILDTGIDLNDPFLKSRISASDCWDYVEDTASIRDEVGHGTHTASILAKTAPRARIFCGRVWKRRVEDNSTGITGELIAKSTETALQAIEDAVDKWKAQIIVMPFAFPHMVEQIDDAIDEYHSRSLLFAATSNQNDDEVGFPARLADVIGVYSNKSPSTQSEFCKLGKEHEYNFSAIGEHVSGSWPQGLEGEDAHTPGQGKKSGTSCSTPIAAGVAALILEFASLKGRVQVDRAAKLKKKSVMEKVLFDCMTDKHTSGTYNLLQPWKLLSGYDGKAPRTLQSIAAAISTSIKESGG